MEELGDHSFDDFSVELEDFEYQQVKSFDRMLNIGEGGSFAQRPLVYNCTVYVGSIDHNVYAIDAKSGEMKWKFKTGSQIVPSSPAESNGIIYIGSHDHNFYAINASDGRLLWKFRTGDKVTGIPCAEGDRVYFGSCDQNLYCLDSKTGDLLWKFRTYGQIPSAPTVYGDKVFVGSFDHFLYCINKETGRLIWKHETQGDVFSQTPLLIHDGKVYFPSFDNYLRAVDINTGKLVWKFLTGRYGGMAGGPVLYKNILYQVNREGALYTLTLDGKEAWNFRISNAMSNPIVHEDRVYFGTEDQNLYCLGLDGKTLWKFPTQGMIWWLPAVWDDKIYFTSWDCNVYCVNINNHELVWKFRSQGEPSYAPPPFDSFELKVSKTTDDSDSKDGLERKTYDIILEDEETPDFYKSRITYQVSTQYSAKGKYQIDSKEEEF